MKKIKSNLKKFGKAILGIILGIIGGFILVEILEYYHNKKFIIKK